MLKKSSEKPDKTKEDETHERSEPSAADEHNKSSEKPEKRSMSQKSQKEDSRQEKSHQTAKATATKNDKIMSHLEEQKWLNELNKNRTGHLYQLQKLENRNEKNYDKPW